MPRTTTGDDPHLAGHRTRRGKTVEILINTAVLNPQLGSLLHTLGRSAPAQREQLALEYAQEALLEMPEVRVVAARCKQGTQADELLVKFELECTLADGQLARSVVEWRMNF